MRYTPDEIAETRANWVAYLRRDGLKKTIGQLADSTDHKARSCLGHYCAMMKVPPEEKLMRGPDGKVRALVMLEGRHSTLPSRLAEALNITPDGEFRKLLMINGKPMRSLSQVNDLANVTLSEIADVIEYQFAADNFHQYFLQ